MFTAILIAPSKISNADALTFVCIQKCSIMIRNSLRQTRRTIPDIIKSTSI